MGLWVRIPIVTWGEDKYDRIGILFHCARTVSVVVSRDGGKNPAHQYVVAHPLGLATLEKAWKKRSYSPRLFKPVGGAARDEEGRGRRSLHGGLTPPRSQDDFRCRVIRPSPPAPLPETGEG